jgi:hypothetical protein
LTIAAKIIVVLFGFWLIGVSVLMIYRPHTALAGLRKMASTNLINYSEITLRMIVGIAFLLTANSMPYAWFFNFFGWFLVISAGVLYCVPRQWHANYAQYWAGKLSVFYVRALAPLSIAAGVFIIKSIV